MALDYMFWGAVGGVLMAIIVFIVEPFLKRGR